MDLNKIYEKEKTINYYFKKKYDYNDEEIFNKQILQLLCELSEFAYETKCFKYWKNDKPSDPSITISEFADCLMITLCFCDLLNIDKIELETINENNIVKLFIEANKIAASITKNLEKDKLIRILSILIKITELLNYNEEELNNYCLEKMNKILKMINS